MSANLARQPSHTLVLPTRLMKDAIPLHDADLKRIARILDQDAGIYVSMEKNSLVHSRLIKILRTLNLSSFKEYCDLVEAPAGKELRREMLMALTTNLTRFFREAHHFEHLLKEALPPLIAKAKMGERIRIWSAGCSNGQEPYSIAAIILSLLPEANNYDIKILASDIDCNMITHGRKGIYSEEIAEKMPDNLRNKHFQKVTTENGIQYAASERLKKLVSFRELNLNAVSWPMRGKFQIIFCRNVVIYFNAETQKTLWNNFRDMLCEPGYLYIGHSERLSGQSVDKFESVGTTTYRLKTH